MSLWFALKNSTHRLCIVSYVFLCIALGACPGGYHPVTLFLALLGFGTLVVALFRANTEPVSEHQNQPPLIEYVCLCSLGILGIIKLPADVDNQFYLATFRCIGVLLIFLVVLHSSVTIEWRRRLLIIILLIKFSMLIFGVLVVQRPMIDVWQLQQSAIDFVLQGKNPYLLPVEDIYDGRSAYGHQAHYSYAPLNLIMSIPSKWLLGDYRFGLIASLGLSLMLFRRCGRLMFVPSWRIDLWTLAFVLHPNLDRLMIHGWLEPYMILFFSFFVYFWLKHKNEYLPTVFLALMPLLKQYFAVPLLLYLLILRPRLRTIAVASLFATVVLSPLFLWNARTVVQQGLLFFIRHVSFRPDSLSVTAAIYAWTGYRAGVTAALATQLVVGLAATYLSSKKTELIPRMKRFLLISSLSMFASFLAAPQSFINYYFFVGWLLLWSGLSHSASTTETSSQNHDTLGYRTAAQLAGVLVVLGAAAWGLSSVLYFHYLCPMAERRTSLSQPVLADGPLRALATERILVCRLRHCFGPLCHADVRCVCADRTKSPLAVANEFGGFGAEAATCLVDNETASTEDKTGLCWLARCHEQR